MTAGNVPVDPLIGRVLGGCRVESAVARGGQGAVYRATQEALSRSVALKVLPPELTASEAFLQRFEREARIIAQLNHPNIVQIHFTGQEGTMRYLVMEWVDGASLAAVLRQRRRLPVQEAATIVLQAAEALRAASSRGIVHRDIKPDNILITAGGTVKVADFGLARHAEESAAVTQTGAVMGSPPYMSPEQCRGELADRRSDIYSLGLTFWECLTGRRAYAGENGIAILRKQIEEPLPRLRSFLATAPPEIEQLIRWMCEKNPADRVSYAGDVADQLRAFLSKHGEDGRTVRIPTEKLKAVDLEEPTIASAVPEPAPAADQESCPACHAPNPADRKFCSACGGRLTVDCAACGYDANRRGAAFCGRCGLDLAKQQSVRELCEKAGALVRERRRDEAIGLLRQATELAPGRADLERWVMELEAERAEASRLKEALVVELEAGRFDEAERHAEALLRINPEDSQVVSLIPQMRATARVVRLEELERQFQAMLRDAHVSSAARLLEEAEAADPGGPAVERMSAAIAERRQAYDEAMARGMERLGAELWSQALAEFRRAVEADADAPEAARQAELCERRIGKIEALKDDVRRALAASDLFRAFDIAAKAAALDPARELVGDAPRRLQERLDAYKTRLDELRRLAAARKWEKALSLGRELSEIQSNDKELQDLVQRCDRAARAVADARLHLARIKDDPLRYPDAASSYEALRQHVPEAEARAIDRESKERRDAFLSAARRELRRLLGRAKSREARQLVQAVRPHDAAVAAEMDAAIDRNLRMRLAATLALFFAIGAAIGYLVWRIMTD